MIEYNQAMFKIIDPETGILIHADGGLNLPYGHGVSVLDGAPIGSGRFPLGSGANPQSYKNFIDRINQLEDEGKNKQQIVKEMELGTVQALTTQTRIAKNELAKYEFDTIRQLTAKGKTDTEIAKIMGYAGESTVRSKKASKRYIEGDRYTALAERLKDELKKNKYLDVSSKTELQLNTNSSTLETALQLLRNEGYVCRNVQFKQMGTDKKTNTLVLAPPGTEYKDMRDNPGDVGIVAAAYSTDGGHTFKDRKDPVSIDSSRIYVRYKENGGEDRDGTIEIRPGVQDLSIGKNHIAQVRIAVDNEHYLKGVALYRDDVPEGYDLVFNTNKKEGTPLADVFKPLKKNDPENPFGSNIKDAQSLKMAQATYLDKDGNEKQSAINFVNEESDWGDWSKKAPYQFLDKQPKETVKKQLDKSAKQKEDEFNEIAALTNPIVKQQLLDEFAKEADSASVHLKAVGFKDQTVGVLTPINSLKPGEVYAPNYENGTRVIAVRYPHAGPFEIPDLVVNNNCAEGIKVLGQSRVAIGVRPETRAQLSGADCDGDTVTLIPREGNDFTVKPAEKKLIEFDTKQYKVPEDKRVPEDENGKPLRAPDKSKGEIARMTKKMHGLEMGKITNLMHDMQKQGAPMEDVIKADMFSMVIVDAKKHYLDWRQAEKDFGIKELRKNYANPEGGPATLVTKARNPQKRPEMEELTYRYRSMTPEEAKEWEAGGKQPLSKDRKVMTPDEEAAWNRGERVYRLTGKHQYKAIKDENGKVVGYEDTGKAKMGEYKRMDLTDDATTLISERRAPSEILYAKYANTMKALANSARKMSRSITGYRKDLEAAKKYAAEVDSLKVKLKKAESSTPLERAANRITQSKYDAYMDEYGWDMDYEDKKKMKGRLLKQARETVGSKKTPIDITDREWEAIQAHAVGSDTLKRVLKNAKPERVKELATPKSNKVLSASDVATIERLLNNGAMPGELANRFGVSVSTIYRAVSD